MRLFEEPVDSFHTEELKFGEGLLQLNEDDFKQTIESVFENWLDDMPLDIFESTLRTIFTLPWTIKMIEIFRIVVVARQLTHEQGEKLVAIFRRECPSILVFVDILKKLQPYGIQEEICVHNTKVKRNRNANVVSYLDHCQKELFQYNSWLNQDSKIPARYNFREAHESKNLICSSITGDVQAGKTSLAIRLAHKSILSGIPAIYVILARRAGHLQLDQRLFDYNKEFEQWCEENRVVYKPLEYVFQADKTAVTHRRINNFLNFQKRKPGLIIVYGNVAQLKRTLEMRLAISEKCSFTLIVDEVDENTKQDSTSMKGPFDQLHDLADSYIGITATSFKYWWMEKQLMNYNCFVLEPHPDYKGIKDLQLDYPIEKTIFCPRSEDPFHKSDHQFEGYIKHLEAIKGYRYIDKVTKTESYHPIICLYRISDINKYHSEVFAYMRKFNRMKWCVLQFDGDEGANIKLYHSDIAASEDVMALSGKTYHPNIDGVYTIDKNSISEVIGFLRRKMMSNDSYKNIMIIVGKLACRQISYVCDEYNWHLTHMRLLRSSSSNDCTELIQQMRLCGIFKHDDIPLCISMKADEFVNLQKAYALQQVMIQKSHEDNPREMKESVFGNTSVGFDKSIIPEMRLQKLIPKRAVKIITEELPNPKCGNEIRLILPDAVSDTTILSKVFYTSIDIILELIGSGKWVERSFVVNQIAKRSPSFYKDENQIRGHLKSLYTGKCQLDGITENTRGFLMRKENDTIYIRIN